MKSQQIAGYAASQSATQARPEKRIALHPVDRDLADYNDRMDWADAPADQLFRACACAASTAAWKEFMRRYHPLLTAAAVRVSRRWGKGTADEIDDIVQEIYIKLCSDGSRVLTDFQVVRPGEEFGYLKVVATNHAHDYYRRRSASKRGRDMASLEDNLGVAVTDAGMERRLALAEVEKALLAGTQTQTGRRDRGIFRLYYQQGMTAKAIAELPGVELTQKGVEGVLHRLTGAVRRVLRPQQESDPS